MPLYSYACKAGHAWEDMQSVENRHSSRCPECGKKGKIQIAAPAVHGFKFGWFEHIGPDGVYAKSKKHLKELCNQYDCYAPGVLD